MPVLYKLTNPSLHAKSRLGFFDLLYPLVADRPGSQPFINLCSPGNSCASKPVCLGKSLNIADFPDIPDKLSCLELTEPAHNLNSRCSAARHCEIRPPTCKNLLSSDFRRGR